MSNYNTLNQVANQLNEAVTKLTVDNLSTDTNKVEKTGDSMTGALKLLNQSELKLGEATTNGTNYVGIKAPAVIASDYSLILPNIQGANNQVLTNDGFGVLSWTTISGTANQSLNTFDNVTFNKIMATTSFIGTLNGDVSGATTVAANTVNATNLTGTLVGDLNGNILKAAQSNVTSVGTLSFLNMGGTLIMENKKQIQFQELTINGTNVVAVQAPSSLASNITLTLPNSAGSLNQALTTDGSGVLSWQSVQPLSSVLSGLSSLSATTGFVAQTASTIFASRTITGTTNQISVTNGDGVAGDPTLSLPQNIHSGASPTFVSATLSGLTASQTVVTDGSKLLKSLVYTPTSTASTIASRDGSGNVVFNVVSADNGFVQSAGQFLINSGTNSLPSLAYSGDGTSGLVFSTGNVDIATGTSRRVRINSSGLTVDNDLTGSGKATITGDFTVTTGNATISTGNLIVSTGITTLQSTLTVNSGGASITGTTGITGNTTITGKFTTKSGAVNIGTDTADDTINIGTVASGGRTINIGNITATSLLTLSAGSGGISITGITTLNDTTESSSISTGALVVSGGTGIAKKLFVGGLLTASAGCAIASGAGAINIANDATTGAINIGTGASARTITIGNITGATTININTGSGNFNFSGKSFFDNTMTISSGGLTISSNGASITGDSTITGKLSITSGCTIDSGSSNNINIATDNTNKDINIGTSGTRTVTIGNTSSSTGLILNAGSGGITMAGITTLTNTTQSTSTITGALVIDGGIGVAKNIVVGGFNKSDYNIITTSVTSLAGTNPATAAQILNGIIKVSVTGTITLDTAANLVAAIPGIAVGDTITVLFVADAAVTITLAGDTGTSIVGPTTVNPDSTRVVYLRFTNVTGGLETIDVY